MIARGNLTPFLDDRDIGYFLFNLCVGMSISDVELDRKKLLDKIRAMSPCHDAYNQKAGNSSEVRRGIYDIASVFGVSDG